MGRLPGSTNQNKKIVNKDIELPKFICYTCGEVSKTLFTCSKNRIV